MEQCEFELFVLDYFGVDKSVRDLITEKFIIETDFGQLVNMLCMFKESMNEK